MKGPISRAFLVYYHSYLIKEYKPLKRLATMGIFYPWLKPWAGFRFEKDARMLQWQLANSIKLKIWLAYSTD